MDDYIKKLENVILNLVDANYGTSLHHIGDGDGLSQDEANEIKKIYLHIHKKHAFPELELDEI